ncbi:hypothetical protein N0V90_004393 [Kalmusia sp. IMI 367209]|nr:hypothetical protein N0V90_004393 [Kalmusia sp. IMI 367209]
MKITSILLALLSTALALPLTVPSANPDVATRGTVPGPQGTFGVSYKKDLISDPQKREDLFPVRYTTDATSDPKKRENAEGTFPVRYSNDLIKDPQKRTTVTPSLFAVGYKKDIIDSTIPIAKPQKREASQPDGVFAVGYRKDIIPTQE